MNGITDRNRKVLQVICEHGYATYKEIEKITGSKRQAYRVIDSMMYNYGVILSFDTGLLPSKGYYLTRKGQTVLASTGNMRVCSLFKPCDYGPSEFFHNLSIIHVRLALEKHPYCLDVESTKVLTARRGELPELKPDAEVIFRETLAVETNTFRAGLEVELRPKWLKRNIRKMCRFDSSGFSHLKSIIWACADNITVEALRRGMRAARVFEPQKHRFLLLGELLEKGAVDCKVMDWQGKECNLFL